MLSNHKRTKEKKTTKTHPKQRNGSKNIHIANYLECKWTKLLHPKDRDWLNGYKNKTCITCCLQETHFRTTDTYRLKAKGWKKVFHGNGNQKSQSSNTYIRQNRLNKDCYKRQRTPPHNNQCINPKRYNNCKYIYTQHSSTSI